MLYKYIALVRRQVEHCSVCLLSNNMETIVTLTQLQKLEVTQTNAVK